MAMPQPLPPEPESIPEQADDEQAYDKAVADSFPASDPPAGVIKLGPRPARPLKPRLLDRKPPQR